MIAEWTAYRYGLLFACIVSHSQTLAYSLLLEQSPVVMIE
jgi:hypothetical protein